MFKKLLLITTLSLGATHVLADDIPTRFGPLTTNADGDLAFKGHPVQPAISNASLEKAFPVGGNDVVLVQTNNLGSSCPAKFNFVTVSPAGAKATPEFGTCTDLIKTSQVGDTVEVRMGGFVGDFNSKAEQRKAAKEKHLYVFANGAVTETKGSKK